MNTPTEPSAASSATAPSEALHSPVIPPPAFFFCASSALILFFAFWTWFTFHSETIRSWDEWIAYSLHAWCTDAWCRDNPTLTHAMVYVTDIGGVAAMTLMAIMGAIWQTAIKHRFLAVAWFAVVLGCAIINGGTKHVYDRDRPPANIRDRAVLENNKSYPSGHAMGSAVGYGMLAYALILPQRFRPRRIAALLLTGAMILAVGFSRIYLRAHWFSDVVAGWSVGLCWLTLCVGVLEWRRRKLVA